MVSLQALQAQVQHLTHLVNRHIGPQMAHSQLNSPHPSPVPTGLIAMWSGSEVPEGWVLCDGTNDTPDLRNRFIVGSGDEYTTGDSGGADSKSLTEAQLPAHTHTDTFSISGGSHRHEYSRSDFFSEVASGTGAVNIRTGSTLANTEFGDHLHTLDGAIDSAGSGEAVDVRPRYYALAYIMKT